MTFETAATTRRQERRLCILIYGQFVSRSVDQAVLVNGGYVRQEPRYVSQHDRRAARQQQRINSPGTPAIDEAIYVFWG